MTKKYSGMRTASDPCQHNDIFWTKYGDSLSSFGHCISSKEPTYVIAMTRKAPRLLELCHLWGVDYGNAQILTEKSLEFVENSALRGTVLVIIDDIIILGSTLHRLLKKYPDLENSTILCLVCNDTWFTKELIPSAEWQLKLGQHEAAVFCNELVQTIGYLNKPYDLDHPILYGQLTFEELASLCSVKSSDTVYEISSSFHRSIGKRRFSFLPDASVTTELTRNLFHNSEILSPQICKCRLYYDEATNHANLAPMLIYDAQLSDIHGGRLSFSSVFDQYNQLIDQLVPDKSKARDTAHFRLLCYLSGYLTGIAFCVRNSFDSLTLISSSLPSTFLNTRDLCYLFGPQATAQIVRGLDAFYPSTVEALERVKPVPFQLTLEAGLGEKKLVQRPRMAFDPLATGLLKRITPYLSKNLGKSNLIVDQLACIFEGLFYTCEIPARNRIKKKRSLRGEPHRLAQGFTFEQVRQILIDFGALDTGDPNAETRLSLALDWLVDCGVIVPFYVATNGSFMRFYRYGEDSLCQQKMGFLFGAVIRDLFRHAQETVHKGTIPKIAIEKILVLLARRLEKSPQDVALLQPDEGMTRTMNLKLGHCIHGAIEEIQYEAETGLVGSQWLSDWCKNQGIVKEDKGQRGLVYSNIFFRQHPEGDSMVTESISSKYSMLAKVLFHLDSEVDPSDDYSYLIALSTCHNAESTLKAMRTELFYLFEARADEEEQFDMGDGYSLEWLLENRLRYLLSRLRKGQAREVESLVKLCQRRIKNADQASNSVLSKYGLYRDRVSMVSTIKSHFREIEKNDAYRTYYQNQLLDLLDNIVDDAGRPQDPGANESMGRLTELGSLCVQVCSLLKLLLSITSSIIGGYITKAGQLHKGTAGKIKREITESRHIVQKLNETIQDSRTRFPGRAIVELPRISPPFSSTEETPDMIGWSGALEDTVTQITSLWSSLKSIYAENYAYEPWRKEIELLFLKDTGVVPLRWVIWYDIKDSQGKRDSSNVEKTPRLKEKINMDLQKTTMILKDGKFTPDKNDEKFIHTVEPKSVPRLLQTLLDDADSFEMFLRIGVAGVDDTDTPFLRVSGTDFLESEKTFALPKRLGTCIYDEDKVNSLKNYAPEAAGIKKETDDSHTLVVSNEAYRKIWNRKLTVGSPVKVGYPVDGKKEYIFHILRNVPKDSNLLSVTI